MLTFAIGDDGRAVDDAFLYESGQRAPLITYGMLRSLHRAVEHELPDDFANMVETGRKYAEQLLGKIPSNTH